MSELKGLMPICLKCSRTTKGVYEMLPIEPGDDILFPHCLDCFERRIAENPELLEAK